MDMTDSQDTTPEPRFEGEPRGTLPAPGQPEGSLPDPTGTGEATPAGGRVDAAGAVTGEIAGSSGEAPPGGFPDDDATLDGDRA
jgi:hypothetical protein